MNIPRSVPPEKRTLFEERCKKLFSGNDRCLIFQDMALSHSFEHAILCAPLSQLLRLTTHSTQPVVCRMSYNGADLEEVCTLTEREKIELVGITIAINPLHTNLETLLSFIERTTTQAHHRAIPVIVEIQTPTSPTYEDIQRITSFGGDIIIIPSPTGKTPAQAAQKLQEITRNLESVLVACTAPRMHPDDMLTLHAALCSIGGSRGIVLKSAPSDEDAMHRLATLL